MKVRSETWIKRNALAVAQLKRGETPSNSDRLAVSRAIERAYWRVYRAVAFDVDGTLTPKGSEHIQPRMVAAIANLLVRGVPVILTTGRGRGAARAAGETVRSESGLTGWYLRRLQCVTHNGVFHLRTDSGSPSAFLRDETLLIDQPADLSGLDKQVYRALVDRGLSPDRFQLSREPHSVRLAFLSETDRSKAELVLGRLLRDWRLRRGYPLHLSRGS